MGLYPSRQDWDDARQAAGMASTAHEDMHAGELETSILLARYPDEGSLLRIVARADLPAAMDLAQGRMKKKVMGAQEALEGGVGMVVLGDARLTGPVSAALSGAGTTFTA